MYAKVAVQHNELSYTEYEFLVVYETRVILQSVVEFTRASTRHRKYSEEVVYSRAPRPNFRRPEVNVEPSIPEVVITEAVAKIRSRFEFQRWEDVAKAHGLKP